MPSGGTVLLVAEKSCQFRFEDGIDAFFNLAAKKFIGGSTTLFAKYILPYLFLYGRGFIPWEIDRMAGAFSHVKSSSRIFAGAEW